MKRYKIKNLDDTYSLVKNLDNLKNETLLLNYKTLLPYVQFNKNYYLLTYPSGAKALTNLFIKTINFNSIEIVTRDGVDFFKLFSNTTGTTYFYDKDLKEHEKYRIFRPFYKRYQTAIIVTMTIGSLSIVALITGLIIGLKKRTK